MDDMTDTTTTNGPHFPYGDHGPDCKCCTRIKAGAAQAQATGRITVTFRALTMQSYSPRREWRTNEYKAIGPDGVEFNLSRKAELVSQLRRHYGRTVQIDFVNAYEARS